MVKSIYLAKIYFTDLKDYKIRPILVIKEIENDCICLPLTTNLAQKGIVLTNNDLTEGILRKDLVVIVPKNFTLHKSIFLKYIGKIKEKKFKEIIEIFCKKIDCK